MLNKTEKLAIKKPIMRNEEICGYIYALPAILGFVIFVLGPMVASFIFSFTDYSIISKPNFVGIDNYKNIFGGQDTFFYKSLGATFLYVLISVPLGLVFSFTIALLLNQNIKGKSIFRTIFYLPTIVPAIVSAILWLWLYNPDFGLLNTVLRVLRLPTSMWLFSENMVIPSLAIMSLWTVGNTIIIFLSGLQGIPRSMYEAAEIDGGKNIHKLIYITIPFMTNTIFFNLIMGLIGGFQVYFPALIMTDGGPNNKSLFYVFYLWREAFKFSKMGYSCALAWILFFIITIFTFIVFKTSGKWVYYGGDER
jgi:multiple sugar transport system permease protein